MYSSGYSKYSMEPRKKMQCRSKAKSCGYYMRIVFFFSSLIQSLIIVSLVLFLIYGKKQDSASTSRIQDLEESFSRLSIENVALRSQRKNLTNLLNTTMTEKAKNDWDLARLQYFTNISISMIQDIDKKLQHCSYDLMVCKNMPRHCPPTRDCNCGLLTEQLKARLDLVESNFTQTTQRMRMEMDQIAKERDVINLEAIRLRRDKDTHEKEVDFFKQKCKDDFTLSLSGVSNVSRAFLEKIDSLFPTHIAFQLTCPKQREHLEQIRTNCSSLSREVEDKFQRYLDSVGQQVSNIQAENSRLKAENWRLFEDYRWCSQNRTGLIQQNKQNLDKLQRKHDEEKERLLMDKMKLNGENDVLTNTVKYKNKVIEHLSEEVRRLNLSCTMTRGSSFPGVQPGRTVSGGINSLFNKPVSTGAGSSLFPSLPGSSSSSGFNKPTSTGAGSSLFPSVPGSSSSSGFNKPTSTGAGSSLFPSLPGSSSGSGFNKPTSTGAGSSLFPSLPGSSSSSGFNKPASTGAGSSLFPSLPGSSSSSGFNKPASTGAGSSLFPSLPGSSSGSGFNKPASTGAGSSLFPSLPGSSSGSGFNKPASTGAGSSLFPSLPGSSSGSGFNRAAVGPTGSNPSLSSSGTGSNKQTLTGRGSSTAGSSFGSSGPNPNLSSGEADTNKQSAKSSSSSTGSTSRSTSTSSGFSWLGFGSSNSGQSKTGTGTGKGSSSGTGSSFGAGRTSGLASGPVSVAQHIQDLQRLINPEIPSTKDNQDLSRVLG